MCVSLYLYPPKTCCQVLVLYKSITQARQLNPETRVSLCVCTTHTYTPKSVRWLTHDLGCQRSVFLNLESRSCMNDVRCLSKQKQNKPKEPLNPAPGIFVGFRRDQKCLQNFSLLLFNHLMGCGSKQTDISSFTSLAKCIAISDKSPPTSTLLGSCYNSNIFVSCLRMFSKILLLLENTKQDTCNRYVGKDSTNTQ